jgi:hypothetical protein
MARELDLEQLPAQEPGDWLNNLQTELSSTELMGAVVTGPFASLPLEGSRPLGEQLVANLTQLDARTVLVEGADPTASGICARGAATFGLRSAKGQPTYLDTLPSVSMIAFVQGEPEWVNLLETDEPWVMGSETWSKSPENTRFSIQPRQTEVIVTVHRGGSPTCREVKAEIESSVPHETPVSLHVSITPGQGAPRVEICPDDRAVFRGQNLTLDWDTATDTGRDPEDELDHVERICPQHEPRLASAQKWRSRNFRYASLTGIRQMVEAYVSGKHEIRLYGNGAKQTLPWLYELLKEVDQAEPRWATAVSSDGVPGGYYRPHIQEDSRLLKEFSLQLDDLIGSQDQGELATKVLATISARPPKLLRRLQRFLSHGYEQHSRPMWWAAGHCLKTPQEIHGLLKIASSSSFGDAFKFCARALMYREDALAATPSDLARGLFAKAVNECRRHLNGARFGLGYREPLALSVYLLRRRKYDPNFVPEGSKEYEDAARIFALAIRLMDANPQNVMGGTIQIRKLTAQVLDYVQRKGKGRLTGLVDA